MSIVFRDRLGFQYSTFAVGGRPDLRLIVYNAATAADRAITAALVDRRQAIAAN